MFCFPQWRKVFVVIGAQKLHTNSYQVGRPQVMCVLPYHEVLSRLWVLHLERFSVVMKRGATESDLGPQCKG